MKKLMFSLVGMLAMSLAGVAQAQNATAGGKDTLGIGSVKATKSLQESAAAKGTLNGLQRVVEAMDTHLLDRFQNTRKFDLVNRSQLDEVMKEINLAGSGILNKNDPKVARAMEGAGCKYIVVTSIDNFNDFRDELVLEGGKKAGSKRIIQISAVATIYDTTSFKVLETASVKLEKKDVDLAQDMVQRTGDSGEKVLSDASTEMCDRIATRVIEVLYPAKVVARTDNIVTLNRGDGSSIAVGQVFDVYALGKEMIDPDTKESLGKEEVRVGQVKVISVAARTSRAEIVDDKGIDVGQVLRTPAEKKSE